MTWNQVKAQWTLDDLYKKISPKAVANYLNCVGNDEERDVLAQEQLDDMAEFYMLTLEDRFQKQYPSSLDEIRTFVLRQKQEVQEYQNFQAKVSGQNDASLPMISSYGSWNAWPAGSSLVTADDGVFGVTGYFGPQLYFVQAPITNDTLKGVAANGSFAGITSVASGQDMPANLLYINRGTMASPDWQVWDPQALVDFIIDGRPLLKCGYQRARYYIRDFATDSDGGRGEYRLQAMPTAAKVARDRATEQEEVALELIRVDLSNIGTASDFAKTMQQSSKQFF